MTDKHWLMSRDDPRTVFLVCLVVLAVGAFAIPQLLAEGGGVRLFGLAWLVVSVGQVIWSGWGLWKFVATRR